MKTVLITGASTGIGRACALALCRGGYSVRAGVRREADGEALAREAGAGLVPVILDVTDPDHIAGAREGLEAAGGELWALVNNAGMSISGPTEFLPLAAYRRQFEVNYFGQIAVTQAFLPSIRRSRGRVVFVGSLNGWIAPPFMGPYAGTKFAMEALSDSLRRELAPWDIAVSLVKPGAIATPIWERSRAEAIDVMSNAPGAAEEFYGEAMLRVGAAAMVIGKRGIPAERVAEAVLHAVAAPVPRTRYLVGDDSRLGRVLRLLPDRWLDWLIARQLDRIASSRSGRAERQALDASALEARQG